MLGHKEAMDNFCFNFDVSIGSFWSNELKISPRESYYLGVFNKVYVQNYFRNP